MVKKFFLIFVLSPLWAFGQKNHLTLEDCITLAWKNNLDIQLAQLNLKQSQSQLTTAKLAQIPSANFSAGQFVQSGRSIDRFSNQFVTKTINSANFQLQSNLTLYAGRQIQLNIQSAQNLEKAGQFDLQSAKQTIAMNVANQFLQALLTQEQIQVAKLSMDNTKEQLTRVEILRDKGSVAESQVLQLKAQMANDEFAVLNAQLNYNAAILNLCNTIFIPYSDSIQLYFPPAQVFSSQYSLTAQQLFDSAVKTRPDLQAAQFRLTSAQTRFKAAKGQLQPTLSLGASAGSVYSSNATTVTSRIEGTRAIGITQSSNDLVLGPNFITQFQDIAFKEQLRQNFGLNVGLNLNVPIFNQGQVRNQIKIAQTETERAELAIERNLQNIKTEIVTAYQSFSAASKKFEAAKTTMDIQEQNLDFAKKRYQNGQQAITDFQLAQNNYNLAKQNLIISKYEFMFRKLVLDFYKTNKITLE